MAYQKHNFKDGDILKAEHLNCIEDCIAEAPNWNAAEGEPGHVLNRTHWVENVVLLEESEAEEYTHETLGKVWEIPKAPILEVGKTYTVVYNGSPFNCVCQPAVEGFSEDPNAMAMGNFSFVGGQNTGEPFVMLISNLYNRVDVVDLSGAASVKVGITGKVVHKLPNEYLPEHLPWTEGGGLVEILPATELAAFDDDGTLALPSGVVLVAGNPYTVNWNGVAYECTPIEYTEDGITGTVLGNFGLLTGGTDTGEPFVMVCAPSAFEGAGASGMVMPLDGSTSVTLAISSGSDGEVHKLDNKYLDLAWLPTLTPSALLENQMVTNQTTFTVPGELYKSLYDGKPIKVVWDGKSYNITVRNETIGGDRITYAGNAGLAVASLPNTGEPFLIVLMVNAVGIYTDESYHSMSIYDMIPNKMPEGYLPESALHLGKELTDEQKEQARDNIGAAPTDVAANTVRYIAQTLTEAQKEQARANIGAVAADTNTQEPRDEDLPRLFLDSPMAESPAEIDTAFHYKSKTADFRGFCRIRTQGSKTLKNPKKDQRLRLYSDADYTTTLNTTFRNWKSADRYLLRANWFDMSHARAIVAARLWPEVQRSRSDFQRLPAAYRQLPLLGAFDGFPVRVYAAGVYQGRFTLNTLVDQNLMGLSASNEKHCMLTCEAGMSAWFRSAALFDGTDWTDELRETLPTALADRWNSAIALVQSGTDVNFKSRLSDYFYVPGLIDYYLFSLLTGTRNAFDGDQVFLCYDGLHFMPALWDLSDAWGLGEDSFLPPQFPRERYDDQENGYGNLLYQRLEEQFADDIRTRWEQLKTGALSVENIVCLMEDFAAACPPHVAADDYAETTAGGSCTEIPLKAENHLGQMRAFVCNRTAFLDTYLATLGQERTLYALTEETVFDGQSDYLDTGLALSAEDKDFTIVLECQLDGTQPMADGRAVLLGNYNAADQSGLVLAADTAHYSYTLCANGVVDNTTVVPRAGNGRLRAVIAHSAGTDLVTVRMGWGGSVVDGSRNGMTGAWKSSNRTLVLGACLDENGNASNFWHGSILSLRVSRQLPNWSYLNVWLREAGSV